MSKRLNSKEQEKLVLENRGLVYYCVKKFKKRACDEDDYISIGTIGLIKAAATYNEARNIKFSTYAIRCINNEILMYLRKNKKYENILFLEDEIIISDDKNIKLTDIIVSEENFEKDVEENIFFIEVISFILNFLSSQERLVMLYRISGYTQKEVAKVLKFSQSYISRIENRAKNIINMYFNNTKKINEVFKFSIINGLYTIVFSPKDIEDFNKILERLLQKTSYIEELPEINVKHNEKQIIIQAFGDVESFCFIAPIITEIDNRKIKNHYNIEGDCKIEKKSKTKEVREYMLSKDIFTVKELKRKFPNFSENTIRDAIYWTKKNGLITATDELGKYIVNKKN